MSIELEEQIPIEQQDNTRPPLAPGQSVVEDVATEAFAPEGIRLVQVYPKEAQLLDDIKSKKMIAVESHRWHKIVYHVVNAKFDILLKTPNDIMRMFGEMRGAKNLEEARVFWEETKAYIEEMRRNGG